MYSPVIVDGRKTLVIPTHELVNNRNHQHEIIPILQKCADAIVKSGEVWKWNRYSGEARLVRLHDTISSAAQSTIGANG